MMDNLKFEIHLELSIDKLKQDLNKYLNLSEDEPTIKIEIEENEGEFYKTMISKEDNLEILNLRLKKCYSKKSNQIPLITIEVIIGNYEILESGLIELEKCVGEFLYDDDMELIDIDFIKNFAI